MHGNDDLKNPQERRGYLKEHEHDSIKTIKRKQKITLTVLLLEFAAIGASMLLTHFLSNFVYLIVAVGMLLLTVIIGANISAIKRWKINTTVKFSKYKAQCSAQIIDDCLVGETFVNGKMTKAVMEFALTIDDKIFVGYKVLNVKKLKKKIDSNCDRAFDERMENFLNDLEINGRRLNIAYIPDKKYCSILDDSDYVFNYFITDVLFAEKDEDSSPS